MRRQAFRGFNFALSLRLTLPPRETPDRYSGIPGTKGGCLKQMIERAVKVRIGCKYSVSLVIR